MAPYLEDIARTERPIIGIGIDESEPATRTTSRLGGLPWWPAADPYPRDAKGNPLFLLLQIDFSETPPLDPFPRFGVLQVFIGAGDLYGCDFDNQRASEGFRVIYHTNLAPRPLEDFSFLLGEPDYLPLEEPLRPRALSFRPDRMPVDCTDYRFEKLLPEIAADEALHEAYCDFVSPPALRLGGYPTFTQQDPRSYSTGADFGDFTLLTVDTVGDIMWGDSGVAQFFMHEPDLKRRDFSKSSTAGTAAEKVVLRLVRRSRIGPAVKHGHEIVRRPFMHVADRSLPPQRMAGRQIKQA